MSVEWKESSTLIWTGKGPIPWNRLRTTTNTKLSDMCCRWASLEPGFSAPPLIPAPIPYPRIHPTLISPIPDLQSLFNGSISFLLPPSVLTPFPESWSPFIFNAHHCLVYFRGIWLSSSLNRYKSYNGEQSGACIPFEVPFEKDRRTLSRFDQLASLLSSNATSR